MVQVEYSAEHRGDHFFITLRDEAHPNSQLLVAPVSQPSDTKASPLRGYQQNALLSEPKMRSVSVHHAANLSYTCLCRAMVHARLPRPAAVHTQLKQL